MASESVVGLAVFENRPDLTFPVNLALDINQSTSPPRDSEDNTVADLFVFWGFFRTSSWWLFISSFYRAG